MRKINLTNEQKKQLEGLHRSERDKRICDRIKAVLLASEDWSASMIAQALRIHETSVNRHIQDYQNEERLKTKNGGSTGYLSQCESEYLVAYLEENTFAFAHQIIAYVTENFGKTFTVPGIHNWLHQHGFSYKKSKGTPHKFDPEKQVEFIKKYKALKSETEKSEEEILFMDAVHPTQATKLACGWIKKGTDKIIETTGSRTRINIIGALALNNIAKTITEQYETINSANVVDFMNKIRQHYPFSTTLNLIMDGAAYHRSAEVKAAAKRLNINIHYLPPYSPNLNPIERLWKVMNEYARNNVYFPTAKDFRAGISKFFSTTLPQIGASLVTRITDNFQVLKPAS